MATPVASPPANICFNCTDIDELFLSLLKLISGSPLPINVIDYVNPYGYHPQNLPEAVWFLIGSDDKIDMECAAWKTKEEAYEVFSNSDFIGWRTILEYFDGQVPHQHKTDWVMEMFNVTMKRLCNENEKKETSYLCRVYLAHSHEIIDNGTRNRLTRPLDVDSNSRTRTPEVNKHDEKETSADAGRFPFQVNQGENLFAMDLLSRGNINFFARDDCLELRDLHSPASPSSSSDNSSATMSIISSGECFDSLALLEELEDSVFEYNDLGKKFNVHFNSRGNINIFARDDCLELRDLHSPASPSSSSDNSSATMSIISSGECFDSLALLEELEDSVFEYNDSDKKLNVSAAHKPDEFLTLPATLGSLVGVEANNSSSDDESFKTAHMSSSWRRDPNNNVAKRAKVEQGEEGPSSSPKPSRSRTASKGEMKNLRKYLCFMPF